MTPVSLRRCVVCGWHGFPLRIWCARCGHFELVDAPADEGVVEAVTTLRRGRGRTEAEPVPLATVRLDEGPRVVARLQSGSVGSRVRVGIEDGAVVACGM
jgi:uncharacterized OB-fold protein